MKQLVVLSGKGGTGKTAVAAALIHLSGRKRDLVDGSGDLAGRNGDPAGGNGDLAVRRGSGPAVVAVDADVDAANLEILIGGRRLEEHEFVGGVVARIDNLPCGGCGDCQQVCRFDAIRPAPRWGYEVDPLACEGCATCYQQCTYQAIEMLPRVSGSWYRSESRGGAPFFHARLLAAQENSGKLVSLIRERARGAAASEDYPLIIVDGPPGIACAAIAASTGADLALIVTEPTLAGLHDLQRVLEMTAHFQIRRLVCINKHDLHPEGATMIEGACRERGVDVLEPIPFDPAVPEAMATGRAVTELRPSSAAARALERLWEQVRDRMFRRGGKGDLLQISMPARRPDPIAWSESP